ncbi:MAG: hypothetical protein EOP84_04200 [Verrucomicrobiaceae bacterium]|nr:MAG: hypothetical protein EOP84_04200 [Verrucomicrobiaceae bacterium]
MPPSLIGWRKGALESSLLPVQFFRGTLHLAGQLQHHHQWDLTHPVGLERWTATALETPVTD